ncbi:MAG: GbsR/MarR family transcriptional regulator [Hyphomicrobiales bacterium]
MENNERIQKQYELIEKIGVLFEQEGMQPVAARILGLLMVSDNEEQTFDEIRETLKISKSAASNGINLLLNVHAIEYITRLGDRKRYFRLKDRDVTSMIKERLEFSLKLAGCFKEVVTLKKDKNAPSCERFNEYCSFSNYLYKNFSKFIKDWEEIKKK